MNHSHEQPPWKRQSWRGLNYSNLRGASVHHQEALARAIVDDKDQQAWDVLVARVSPVAMQIFVKSFNACDRPVTRKGEERPEPRPFIYTGGQTFWVTEEHNDMFGLFLETELTLDGKTPVLVKWLRRPSKGDLVGFVWGAARRFCQQNWVRDYFKLPRWRRSSVIAQRAGRVSFEETPEGKSTIVVTGREGRFEYEIPYRHDVRVSEGDVVDEGRTLTELKPEKPHTTSRTEAKFMSWVNKLQRARTSPECRLLEDELRARAEAIMNEECPEVWRAAVRLRLLEEHEDNDPEVIAATGRPDTELTRNSISRSLSRVRAALLKDQRIMELAGQLNREMAALRNAPGELEEEEYE